MTSAPSRSIGDVILSNSESEGEQVRAEGELIMPEKALAKKRKRKKRKNTAAAEKTRSDDDSDVMPPPTSRRKQQHLQSLEKDQGPSVPGTPMVGTKTDVRLTTNTDPKYTSQQARKQHQNAEEKEKEEKDETGRIDEEYRRRERQELLEAAKVEEGLRMEQERLRRENERLQREEERIRMIEAESLEREKKWERIMQEQREKEARQRIEKEQRDKERQLLHEYEAWKNRKTRTEKEWTTIVREEIAQILTKELTSRTPLHQAFINMRKSYMDSASKYSPGNVRIHQLWVSYDDAGGE